MKLEKSDRQLETIVSRISANELDLQPDFQRGEIWDSKRRQRLIDTILRDWYIPAIHIVIDADGNEVVLAGSSDSPRSAISLLARLLSTAGLSPKAQRSKRSTEWRIPAFL